MTAEDSEARHALFFQHQSLSHLNPIFMDYLTLEQQQVPMLLLVGCETGLGKEKIWFSWLVAIHYFVKRLYSGTPECGHPEIWTFCLIRTLCLPIFVSFLKIRTPSLIRTFFLGQHPHLGFFVVVTYLFGSTCQCMLRVASQPIDHLFFFPWDEDVCSAEMTSCWYFSFHLLYPLKCINSWEFA